MTSDREEKCWVLAREAERDHGDAAEAYALTQSDLASASGDNESAAVWHAAAVLLRDLHSIGRPIRKLAKPERGSP